jgi:hypothetical protein
MASAMVHDGFEADDIFLENRPSMLGVNRMPDPQALALCSNGDR